MPASVLLPQFFLPLSAVNLGRFVTNVDEPHRDFHDPVCDPNYDITEKVQAKYDSVHRSANHSSFASELTSFLCSSFSKRSKTSIRITANQVKTYYLNNTGQWFRDAVQSEQTRKWIERTIDEGDEIYVVVGYHTVLDARIVEQSGEQRTSGGSLTIPVSTALPSAGVAVLFGGLTDPSLAGSRGRIEDEQRCFVAQGEQIWAVQYHKSEVVSLMGHVSAETLEQPEVARVMHQMQQCSIVHFACHGVSHAVDPSESGLLLQTAGTATAKPRQDILSVRKVSQAHLSGAEIAYLSACSTAENRAIDLVDEVIHLVSAFQVAGFRHVVGCLWPSSDIVCVEVAKSFYSRLSRHRAVRFDDRYIALALHEAVVKIKNSDEYRKRPLHWAQYVHFGA
ncbi:hypothetical protein V502_02551 [Pseudogymnoascus sp. VKM F-4520 (FW-2644)]|nr:hypothetical protein V502_02551 [Pseudogymnoascus sp. VKM F-4520 (FW-2644)]